MSPRIKIRVNVVKELMEKEHLNSQAALADKLGISTATLSRVLSGERNPGPSVIICLLNYFDVDFEMLFYFDNPLSRNNKRDFDSTNQENNHSPPVVGKVEKIRSNKCR